MQCTPASGDTKNVPWTTRNGLYSSLHWGQLIIMLLQISTKEVLQIWTTSRLISYRFDTLATKYYSRSKLSTCSLSKLITNCCFSCNCSDHPYTRKMHGGCAARWCQILRGLGIHSGPLPQPDWKLHSCNCWRCRLP